MIDQAKESLLNVKLVRRFYESFSGVYEVFLSTIFENGEIILCAGSIASMLWFRIGGIFILATPVVVLLLMLVREGMLGFSNTLYLETPDYKWVRELP